MSEPENGRITFTVKELLAKMDGKLDDIVLSLASKAEERDLEALAGRVTAIEQESEKLRAVADALIADGAQRFKRSHKIAAAAVVLVQLGLSVLALAPDIIG